MAARFAFAAAVSGALTARACVKDVPIATPPASLRALEDTGLLYGPAVNKLTLMNYVTPATVRALEWLTALLPELPHVYLTSSRDESVDKALRLIRVTRKTAQVAISLESSGRPAESRGRSPASR